jgi:hypothetical protein
MTVSSKVVGAVAHLPRKSWPPAFGAVSKLPNYGPFQRRLNEASKTNLAIGPSGSYDRTLGQELLRDMERGRVRAILGHEQPAGEAGFNHVEAGAGRRLRELR